MLNDIAHFCTNALPVFGSLLLIKRDQNVNKTYSSLLDKLENEELPACVTCCHETVGTSLK